MTQTLRSCDGVRCTCGHFPGRHRWGDNACPNPLWRCGNGKPQWLQVSYQPITRDAAALSAAQR